MLIRVILLNLLFVFDFAYSSVQVPFITGNFTFIATRYSNFIGDFDEKCSIIAPMVKLTPGENLCDLDTIQINVTVQVLITFIILNFDCFEEVAYENVIKLGDIAVVDAVGSPPGTFHSVHNLGQKFKQGDFSFLQVYTELFGTFGLEGISPVFDFLNGTPIVIQGCADTNLFIHCFETYQIVYSVFTLVALFGIFIGYQAAKRVTWTASSLPRIVLIGYESLFLFVTAIVLFFGLELRPAKNLLDGHTISAQSKDILGIVQLIGNIHVSLLNAIYWNALRKGQLNIGENIFLSPWQLFAALLILSVTIGLVHVVDNFYRGEIEIFKRLLQFDISVDIVCGSVMFLTMLQFILSLRKFYQTPIVVFSFQWKKDVVIS
eukprot:snap_masked-scaffold_51-processed-gene-0.20-mRNA-1 protein AED:1.00 eAED:1.00 QI:0/0/0/0/1/1/2/0/376